MVGGSDQAQGDKGAEEDYPGGLRGTPMVLINIFLAGPEPGLVKEEKEGPRSPPPSPVPPDFGVWGSVGGVSRSPTPPPSQAHVFHRLGGVDRSRVWAPRPPFYWPKPQPSEQTTRSDVRVQRGSWGCAGRRLWGRASRGRGQGARADALCLHVGHQLVGDLGQHVAGQARHAQHVVARAIHVVPEGHELSSRGRQGEAGSPSGHQPPSPKSPGLGSCPTPPQPLPSLTQTFSIVIL